LIQPATGSDNFPLDPANCQLALTTRKQLSESSTCIEVFICTYSPGGPE
jgi:hypothetical protein